MSESFLLFFVSLFSSKVEIGGTARETNRTKLSNDEKRTLARCKRVNTNQIRPEILSPRLCLMQDMLLGVLSAQLT